MLELWGQFESMFDRVMDKIELTVQIHFLEQSNLVRTHGFLAQRKFGGDLSPGFALAQHLEDFEFAV